MTSIDQCDHGRVLGGQGFDMTAPTVIDADGHVVEDAHEFARFGWHGQSTGGHGVEASGAVCCCANCALASGVEGARDRVEA